MSIYEKQDEYISILSTHVDDIMQISNCLEWKKELHDCLLRVYSSIDMQSPGTAYLGLDIRRGSDLRDIYVSQSKLTKDIIEMYLNDSDKIKSTPSRLDILEIINQEDDQCRSEQISQTVYLSLIMKLIY
jgi:hypothetical protein